MSFKPNTCKIPTVYCGKGNYKNAIAPDNTRYIRKGTALECISKGVAVGIMMEKAKRLPKNSLQHIKYVGETYEKKFKRQGIKTLSQLITFGKKNSAIKLKSLLQQVFKKSDNIVDQRAYNSTLIILYRNGNSKLPPCKKI